MRKMADKYYRLVCFVVDICADVLRKYLVKLAKTDAGNTYTSVDAYLSHRIRDVMQLFNNKKLRRDQYDLLYPGNGTTDENKWDISILVTLITELFATRLQPLEIFALKTEIREIRNELQHHPNTGNISDDDFDDYWERLDVSIRLIAKNALDPNDEASLLGKINQVKCSHLPNLGDCLRIWHEETSKQLLNMMNEVQANAEEKTYIHRQVTVQKPGLLGDKNKRIKVSVDILARLQAGFVSTMIELSDDFNPPSEVTDIRAKLRYCHHVVVTGCNNSRYFETALAAVKGMDYNYKRCVEMHTSSDWRHIDPEDVDLVLCRDPFGRISYDESKAKAMEDIFKSMIHSTKRKNGDKALDIVIVTDLKILEECKMHHDHEILDEVVKVFTETSSAQPADLTIEYGGRNEYVQPSLVSLSENLIKYGGRNEYVQPSLVSLSENLIRLEHGHVYGQVDTTDHSVGTNTTQSKDCQSPLSVVPSHVPILLSSHDTIPVSTGNTSRLGRAGMEDLKVYLKRFYSKSATFNYFCCEIEGLEYLSFQIGPTFENQDMKHKKVTALNQNDALVKILQMGNYRQIFVLATDTAASANLIVSSWLNFADTFSPMNLDTPDGVFLLQIADADDVTDLNIMLEERFEMKELYYNKRILIIFEYIDTDHLKLKAIYDLACSCKLITCKFIIITKIDKPAVLDLKLDIEFVLIANKDNALQISSKYEEVSVDIDGQKLSKCIDQIVSKRKCTLWQKDAITKICFENIHPLNKVATIRVPKDIKIINFDRCGHNIQVMHYANHLDISEYQPNMNPLPENICTLTLKTIAIHFTISSHIFNNNVYEQFAYEISKATHIESLLLCDMKFGKKYITVELQKEEIGQIRRSIESKEDYYRFGARILGPHLRSISFDKEDVHAEDRNSMVKQIMIDLICYELVKTHSSVSECYPSEMENGAIKLICFVNDEVRIDSFKGFPLIKRDYNCTSKESLLAENSCDREDSTIIKATKEEFVDINETLSFHAEALMTTHRNLEAVKVSFVQHKEVKLAHSKLCIVLYCRAKGYKPYGDPSFPQSLNHPFKCKTFRTDVREGYFSPNSIGHSTDFNKTLALGCSIGEVNGTCAATLGPFVNIKETNETCFLTVRHVFVPTSRTDQSLTGVKVVQPADVHLPPGADGMPDRQCGEVIASQTGGQIDASIVKISPGRLPKSGQFIQLTREDLKIAGLTEQPVYNDGKFLDAKSLTVKDQATRRIIKIGCTTSLTKGTLSTTDGCVRETLEYSSLETLFNGSRETFLIKSQFMVDSYVKKIFSQAGDSGSGVFLVDDNNHLHCIGMLIGVICNDFTAVITPIDNILKILGHNIGKTLELKQFRETDEMDES